MSSQPIGMSGIAGRYATALFDLARDGGAIDEAAGDLADIEAMIGSSDDLRRMISSPLISREEQRRAMDAVLEKTGISDLTRRFVAVVAANHRLFALDDMIKAFGEILARHRGEVTAEVTSAQPLSQTQLDVIAAALAETTGAKVALSTEVDPDIIGGLVVKIGSRMVDSSLRTKLQRLELVMKGAA